MLTPDGSTRWEADASVAADADLETLEALGTAVGETIRDYAGGELPQFQDG